MPGVSNTICIGHKTAENLISGDYNAFLGDGAGEGIKECSYTFILKTSLGTLSKTITKEQWDVLREIIRDATITDPCGYCYKML